MWTDNGSPRLPAPADVPVGIGRRGETERGNGAYGKALTWDGSALNGSDSDESSDSAPLGVTAGRSPDE